MDPDVDEHEIYAAYRDDALNLRFRSEEASALGVCVVCVCVQVYVYIT